MEYCRLTFDIEIPGTWYLAEIYNERGEYILPIKFTQGLPFSAENLGQIKVIQFIEGQPMDFTFTDLGVPIVSKQLAVIVEQIDPQAIQRIPVLVTGKFDGVRVNHTNFEILNIVRKVECLDFSQTTIERYTEKHGQPDKIGQIRGLFNLKILPKKANDHHIFRLAEWQGIIIISGHLKSILENAGFTGMWLIPV